jgi:hypothetical protein
MQPGLPANDMSTCRTCAPSIDCPQDALFPYSITGSGPFQFVITCPDGANCTDSLSVTMVCCETELSQVFEAGTSLEERTLVLQTLIDQCNFLNAGCTDGGDPDIPETPVTEFFLNSAIYASGACSEEAGGGTYRFSTLAGTFLAETQEEANALALAYAQSIVDTRGFCLSTPGICPCVGVATEYLASIVRQSNNSSPLGPFTVELTATSLPLPTGYAVTVSGGSVRFNGTAATPGNYLPTLRITDSLGGELTRNVSMSALQIGHTLTANSFVVPAVAATVVVTVDSTANSTVGDVVQVSQVNGSGVTIDEFGTFEITAIGGATSLTLENLTATQGETVPNGAKVYEKLTTLPEFEQGVDYSYQIQGSGGSGDYSFRISSGSLPAGLEMSLTGLIAGTPTGVTDSNFTVEMIDNVCQSTSRDFFTPRARLVTVSTRTIATVLGYDEFGSGFQSTPPKRYKKITWDGQSEIYYTVRSGILAATITRVGDVATCTTASPHGFSTGGVVGIYGADQREYNSTFVITVTGANTFTFTVTGSPTTPATGSIFTNSAAGRAKYVFGGVGEISNTGAQVSQYTKEFYAQCQTNPYGPSANVYGIATLQGFCWTLDPANCPTCVPPAPLVSSFITGDPTIDQKDYITYNAPGYTPGGLQPTSNTYAERVEYVPSALIIAAPVTNFPQLFGGSAVIATSDRDYNATLSDEYTDAIALANASVTVSNSVVAYSYPRTTGYTSRWQTVAFQIRLSNLVVGEAYTVLIDFVTDLGATTTTTYNFTATGPTHTISDNAPVPPSGRAVEVTNPRASYTY